MPHPFEVGKTFRNRIGEYTVVSIDGNRMKIRYVSGGTLVTDVNIQGRIWENIQLEEEQTRADERRRQALEARLAARAKTKESRAKPSFAGFQQGDFEAKRRGVAWPTRKNLGKALAFELSQHSKNAFEHWLVPYQSLVHVARKDSYDSEAPGRNAAFFAAASERGVSCGLAVGKPDGELLPIWPWPVFVTSLAEEQAVRETLLEAIRAHGLALEVYAMHASYGLVARVTLQEGQFLWHEESTQEGVDRPMGWDELASALQALAPGKRSAIHICKSWPVEESVGLGAAMVGSIGQIFRALLPAYEAAIAG
ncbi:MAG TPA: hypothetical protein PKO09_13440 [Anaerolineae bacterium]|nr:hypothetical protein [Anaerolineae bacterium]